MFLSLLVVKTVSLNTLHILWERCAYRAILYCMIFFLTLTVDSRQPATVANPTTSLQIQQSSGSRGPGPRVGWPTYLWVGWSSRRVMRHVHIRVKSLRLGSSRPKQMSPENKGLPQYKPARSKRHGRGPDPCGSSNCAWKCSLTCGILTNFEKPKTTYKQPWEHRFGTFLPGARKKIYRNMPGLYIKD